MISFFVRLYHREKRVVAEAGVGTRSLLSRNPEIIGLKPSVAEGFRGYWGSSGRDIVVSISTIKGSAFQIYPLSVDPKAQRNSRILVNIF